MKRPWLTRNVLVLGLVSLLTDVASEMVLPVLPLFITVSLGGTALWVGIAEGVAEATAAVLKLVSGRASDRTGRRRPFLVSGYGLAAAVRPLAALALAPWHMVVVRALDRVGKGLRTSPRDALIAASVPASAHGRAFSFHRAMDHTGAVIGPLVAFAVLSWWTTDLRTLIWLTAIPGGLAVLVVALLAREEASPPPPQPSGPAADSRRFLRFLVPLGLFTLGNSSDAFLLLKAHAEGAPVTELPLLWMGLHAVKVAASIHGGRLADRWGHRPLVGAGWLVYAAIYALLAFAEDRLLIVVLFVLYGTYHGLTEGAERALVAEATPARARGAGFGWFHLVQGTLALAASVLFGALWEVVSPRSALLTGSALALAAVAALAALAPGRPDDGTGPKP